MGGRSGYFCCFPTPNKHLWGTFLKHWCLFIVPSFNKAYGDKFNFKDMRIKVIHLRDHLRPTLTRNYLQVAPDSCGRVNSDMLKLQAVHAYEKTQRK